MLSAETDPTARLTIACSFPTVVGKLQAKCDYHICQIVKLYN